MSKDDLTRLLHDWPYKPGSINARLITGADGRPKLQVRVDLGILHMEIDGRPDGTRPHDCETLIDFQQQRLKQFIDQHGSSIGFELSSTECAALRAEAVQFYHRYVALFAVRDFDGVIRDTERSLAIFDICRDFGETERDRTVLEQFRPQALTTATRSKAELAITNGQPKAALQVLDDGLEQLRQIYDESDMVDDYEQSNEVQLLRGMRDMLVPKLPSSQKAELLERLRAALDAENYELAAILRDELKMMR